MLWLMLGLVLLAAVPVLAQDAPPEVTVPAAVPEAAAMPTIADALKASGDMKIALDTVWVLITAFLVFFMNTGFAMVESGLCRSKNAVNILAKNFIVFACASLAFLILGWGLMFGDGNGIIGMKGLFMAGGADNSPMTGSAYQGVYGSLNWTGIPMWAKFFFQLVFAGTAATIVSGAVAERIKFGSFILFSFILCGVIYPVIGHWIWGGGFLAKMGMLDFAGSSVVHSIGGWAALVGAMVLGPRLGKYNADGSANAIPAHNMTSVCLGGLILWFGWFGFNPGSTMAADWGSIGHIAVTTNTAAAAATISAAITAWLLLGKPDFSMIINGTLAGLVAITAPCAFVSVTTSLIIGLIAGVIVVASVIFVDRKLKIDDPVGALSVHLLNGVFGTLCVGLFADPTVCPAASVAKKGLLLGGGMAQLTPQIIGVLAVGGATVGMSLIVWLLIKATVGLRVSDAEQIEGLDLGEHDQAAYPDFAQTFVKSYHLREV
ncbi:MAG: ammonium transporter [Phycisphaerales bacterium]